MSTLYISEFKRQGRDNNLQTVPAVNVLGAVSSKVTYTSLASVLSSNFDSNTYIIRVLADADCYISVGVTPVADAAGVFVKADAAEYFSVDASAGSIIKIAVKGA